MSPKIDIIGAKIPQMSIREELVCISDIAVFNDSRATLFSHCYQLYDGLGNKS